MRSLGELNTLLAHHPYHHYLHRQAIVSFARDRNAYNQYGVHWAGPIAAISAATQASAVDAQVADLR